MGQRSDQRRRQEVAPVAEMGSPSEGLIVNPPNMEKLSDALLDLLAPFLSEEPNLHEIRNAIGIASLSWNLALLPAARRPAELRRILEAYDTVAPPGEAQFWLADAADASSLRADFKELVTRLVARKLKLYPHEQRPIPNYRVWDAGDEIRIVVESHIVLPPEEKAPQRRRG